MKIKARFILIILLASLFSATTLTSCAHKEVPSEDLFFQALELSSSGSIKEAASTYAECIIRRDEWADIASEQLLELLSEHPYTDISRNIRDAINIAHEYHPVKQATLRIKQDFPVTFSALTLSGFSQVELDDVASSWLTKADDKRTAAMLLEEAADLKDTRAPTGTSAAEKWSLLFYAGRLYEKNGAATRQEALSCYLRACSEAYSELTYDRPLWYFLELTRKSGAQNAAAKLRDYSSTWNDPEYFDDFLDRLASDLLSGYNWKTFFRVFRENEAFFSNTSRAKYAVICARLLECGLCSDADAGGNAAETAAELYETTLENAPFGSYYDLLARFMTGTPFTTEPKASIPLETVAAPEEESDVSFTERLLGKFIEHDYPDLAWRTLQRDCGTFSTQSIQEAYTYLLSKADAESRFRPLTSLALQTARTRPGDETLMKLSFPQYYRELIEDEARQYGLEPWILFALIHSESCFQADITSAAGAHGLTQLMEATAGDVARKLKISEYDLNDAATNVRFGSFYLSELTGRLDGDTLLAAFSYNAGITRVRNWRRKTPNLPLDIFLETVPYEETRLYGQKILRSTVMYGMLYYGEDYADIMESILKIPY